MASTLHVRYIFSTQSIMYLQSQLRRIEREINADWTNLRRPRPFCETQLAVVGWHCFTMACSFSTERSKDGYLFLESFVLLKVWFPDFAAFTAFVLSISHQCLLKATKGSIFGIIKIKSCNLLSMLWI
jgi:hypothetical protein